MVSGGLQFLFEISSLVVVAHPSSEVLRGCAQLNSAPCIPLLIQFEERFQRERKRKLDFKNSPFLSYPGEACYSARYEAVLGVRTFRERTS